MVEFIGWVGAAVLWTIVVYHAGHVIGHARGWRDCNEDMHQTHLE